MFKVQWEQGFRSKSNNSSMGIEFAKKYPWKLADFEIERFNEAIMARPRKDVTKPSDQLVEALKFLAPIGDKKHIESWQDHCVFNNGYLLITDDQVSAGYPVDDDLVCAPNYKLFLKSLSKTGKELAMTLLENGTMSIKGEKIRAIVPCMPLADIHPITPDPPCALINDNLKAAFKACGIFTDEAGTRLIETSLLLRGYDCTGTDGKAIIQYGHGIDLPPNLAVPYSFTKAVAEASQTLTSFGFTEGHSITFYFEGGMWMKTLLYADQWPDIDGFFNQQCNPSEYPKTLLEGVEAVDDFSENNAVYLNNNSISSHRNEGVGASYDVPGLQGGKIVDPKYLTKLLPYAATIDYTTVNDRIFFFGENIRGVIMARTS